MGNDTAGAAGKAAEIGLGSGGRGPKAASIPKARNQPQATNAERAIAVTATLRPERLYHGWCVVAAAFLIALFGWGLGFTAPASIWLRFNSSTAGSPAKSLQPSRPTISRGQRLILLFGGVFERWGARTVVAVGAIAMACSVVLLTLIARPWQITGVFAVMALGWAAMSGAASTSSPRLGLISAAAWR